MIFRRRSRAVPGRPDRESRTNADASAVECIKQMGQVQPVPAVESNIYTITIIGQIEGHMVLPPQNKTTKYEHVIPQLVAVEQSPKIEGSDHFKYGGRGRGGGPGHRRAHRQHVQAHRFPGPGGGHSIGVPIAVGADYSFISETATMTIHPLRLSGFLIGVPQTFEYLDKMQDRVIRFVVKKTRITEEKLRELMFSTGQLARDIGTVLVGKDAVEVGLIREVGGLGSAISRLNRLIKARKEGGGP